MIEASDFYPLTSQIALWMQLDHSFTTQVETEYKKQQRKVNDIFNCGERLEITQVTSESENYIQPWLTWSS